MGGGGGYRESSALGPCTGQGENQRTLADQILFEQVGQGLTGVFLGSLSWTTFSLSLSSESGEAQK